MISINGLEAVNTPFQKYDNYHSYLEKWETVVGDKEYIHDVSHLAVENQTCYDRKCEFFYYQYKQDDQEASTGQRTVLFVSGFHGDERLGPHALIHGYQHFKGQHIIYFPMANPSGFLKKQAKTYPSNIDPYLDFPFDNNTRCYESSASRILDYLYRQYKIDLTIVLRNGQTHIGYGWGTKSKKEDKTEQHEIYAAIAQLLSNVGVHEDRLLMPKFQASTLNQRFYSTRGSFSDWAYGATKHSALLSKCKAFEYAPYQQKQMNGLVFTFQIGPLKFNRQDLGTDHGVYQQNFIWRHHHGYVSRAIKVLKNLTYFLFPKLSFERSDTNISVTVKGCFKTNLHKLRVHRTNTSSELLYEQKDKQSVAFPLIIQLSNKGIDKQAPLSYSAEFQCDGQWERKGTTFFASKRLYKIQNQPAIQVNPKVFTQYKYQQKTAFVTPQDKQVRKKKQQNSKERQKKQKQQQRKKKQQQKKEDNKVSAQSQKIEKKYDEIINKLSQFQKFQKNSQNILQKLSKLQTMNEQQKLILNKTLIEFQVMRNNNKNQSTEEKPNDSQQSNNSLFQFLVFGLLVILIFLYLALKNKQTSNVKPRNNLEKFEQIQDQSMIQGQVSENNSRSRGSQL